MANKMKSKKLTERVSSLLEFVSQDQLNKVERAFDQLFAKIGMNVEFTKHFVDRVNDSRNRPEITVDDLIDIFGSAYKKHGKQIHDLGPDAQAVLKDIETDVNIPFVLVWNARTKQLDMVNKTIMRKANFASSTPFIKV